MRRTRTRRPAASKARWIWHRQTRRIIEAKRRGEAVMVWQHSPRRRWVTTGGVVNRITISGAAADASSSEASGIVRDALRPTAHDLAREALEELGVLPRGLFATGWEGTLRLRR